VNIYTIGHSTRPIEEFVLMLAAFDVRVVADIRRFPGSKRHPQFNQEELRKSLEQAEIKYIHFPELGGRRNPIPDSHNTAWRNKAFMGYADYMETGEFKLGIERLEQVAKENITAFMCSEAVWWRCHRSLVSDYLKIRGWDVWHIMDVGKATEHPYSSAAQVKQGNLFYGEKE
jgi:uncharacterized protein (DUF488 family)